MGPELKQYIDVEDALARMCGSKKIYVKALNMFLNSAEMDDFQTAVAENDLDKAGRHIHTLRGVAGNLSLTGLFEQSDSIMRKLRLGEAVEPQLLESYRETYVRTRGYIQELIRELSA